MLDAREITHRGEDADVPVTTAIYTVQFVMNEEDPNPEAAHVENFSAEIQRVMDEADFTTALRYDACTFEVVSRVPIATTAAVPVQETETRYEGTGEFVKASTLPPGAIVRASTGAEYVRCQNIPSLMRWGQPIPDSENWLVEQIGQLSEGEDLTNREKAEVEAVRKD